MSFYDMSWLTGAEGLDDAVDIQLDLMSPFNVFDMVKEPSLETLIKSAYMPTMAYLGYYGAAKLVGEAAPGFWVRRALSYEAMKGTVKVGARFVPGVALASVPVAISVTGAVAYEAGVNQPLRDAHFGAGAFTWWRGNSSSSRVGLWFGPFASGFGSVV